MRAAQAARHQRSENAHHYRDQRRNSDGLPGSRRFRGTSSRTRDVRTRPQRSVIRRRLQPWIKFRPGIVLRSCRKSRLLHTT